MRHLLATALLALLSLAVRADVIDIDNAQLAKMLKDGATVVDVRTEPEWQDTGVVKGAHLMTFFDAQGHADAPAWLARLKSVAKPADPVVVICRSGNRSRVVSQFLSEQAGYTKVYNVKAGMKGWVGNGGPVVPAAPVIAGCRAAKTC